MWPLGLHLQRRRLVGELVLAVLDDVQPLVEVDDVVFARAAVHYVLRLGITVGFLGLYGVVAPVAEDAVDAPLLGEAGVDVVRLYPTVYHIVAVVEGAHFLLGTTPQNIHPLIASQSIGSPVALEVV